ncbi:bacterial aa3 type cytochrome c oxidase subunit IV family protein [Asticcacaulis biprosthecium C19]|uniref:Bacterial aa3 type cytochrome c oxidase subunit IV family protein n=1 Tax=Asticcacaulis biprosthecium C19 TaxID=715226 RepID=F4QPV6_9CAUL|nr:aa3-type cytochrome c oxidase subunit IV [Asticcacaulis biprosthecium]EGF90243.1 bacterial aa3 type cytochrome c oxidase subunit IV family protein [Asticcacaulis biprosthecium C19]
MADHHDHDSHSDYVRGEMDIHQHRGTYGLFAALTKWGSLNLAVFLTFIIILTCTKLGLIAAGVSAVVVAVVGWFLLKKKADPAH